MPNMTTEEYNDFMARRFPRGPGRMPPMAPVDREGDLHDQILDDIRRRGWLAIHSRMDMPTTTAPGVPDFGILADGGRTFWIECKARSEKLKPKQLAFHAIAHKLGHCVVTVWNFEDYLRAIERTVE